MKKLILFLAIMFLMAAWLWSRVPKAKCPPLVAAPSNLSILAVNKGPTNELHAPTNAIGLKMRDDFTPAQKIELAAKFRDKFQPVANRWMNAYDGHVPFGPELLSLDNFIERLGDNDSFFLYTFVLGDFTFTMQESSGQPKVSYMASRESMQLMNQLSGGSPPTLQLPVTREEVAVMVKADTSVNFPLNQIFVIPTGVGSAMDGGANVIVAPPQNNPALGPAKLSMVFGSNTNLAYYLRDVAF